ncbi:hypothetical protein EC968_010300 [Mortierella alpina]|nr:hypothetical protein EC968_010300 [Mortierella alpina]
MPSNISLQQRKFGSSNDPNIQRLTTAVVPGRVQGPQAPEYQSLDPDLKTGYSSQVIFEQKPLPASETQLELFMQATSQSHPENAPYHVAKCPSLSYSGLPPRAIVSHARVIVTGDYPGLACNERVFTNPKFSPVQSLRWTREPRLEEPKTSRRQQHQSLYRKQKAVPSPFDRSHHDTNLSESEIAAYPPILSCEEYEPCPKPELTAAGASQSKRWRSLTMTADTRMTTLRANQTKQGPGYKSPFPQPKAQTTGSNAVGCKCHSSAIGSVKAASKYGMEDAISDRGQDSISVKVLRGLIELERNRRERDRNRNEDLLARTGGNLPYTSFSAEDERKPDSEGRCCFPSIGSASEMVSGRISTSAQSYRDELWVCRSNTSDNTQELDSPSDAAALSSAADCVLVKRLQLSTQPGGSLVSSSEAPLAQRIRRSSRCINEPLKRLSLGPGEYPTSMYKVVSSQPDSGYSSYASTVDEHEQCSQHCEANEILQQGTPTMIDTELASKFDTSGNRDPLVVEDIGMLRPVHFPPPPASSPISSTHNITHDDSAFAAAYHFRHKGFPAVEGGSGSNLTDNDNLSTIGQPFNGRADDDMNRGHPYRHHRLFYSHPHLRDLYPPIIPAFVRLPVQPSTYYTSEDCEQAVSIGPNYVPVLDNTVVVTCESCRRRFVMTANRLDVLDRHQRLFCRTALQQKLQRWWCKLETRLGFGAVVDPAEENILSGSGELRNAARHRY